MGSSSIFMNSFTLSMQRLTVALDAKAVAPDVQPTAEGIPPVFEERRTVDEDILFMPVEVAKELALSLLQVVDTQEKRSGLKIGLPHEKQEQWEAAVAALRSVQDEQRRQQENEE